MGRNKGEVLLMKLFWRLSSNKKPNVTFKNRKEEYYRNYFFSKKLCDGVELIALIERLSKKDAANMLLERGLSAYMGDNLTKVIKSEAERNERRPDVKLARFLTIIRRLAKQK
jgi:hypothetical protein